MLEFEAEPEGKSLNMIILPGLKSWSNHEVVYLDMEEANRPPDEIPSPERLDVPSPGCKL
jgi:hypothetical protein